MLELGPDQAIRRLRVEQMKAAMFRAIDKADNAWDIPRLFEIENKADQAANAKLTPHALMALAESMALKALAEAMASAESQDVYNEAIRAVPDEDDVAENRGEP